MGGEPYFYVVDYQEDLQQVLNELRNREFEAGRYNPVIPNLSSYFDEEKYLNLKPGKKHTSIDEAMEAAAENGTRSILDINLVADEPNLFAASPLRATLVKSIFGTEKPTVDGLADKIDAVLENVESRGMCRYLILYENNKPAKVCFAGISFD